MKAGLERKPSIGGPDGPTRSVVKAHCVMKKKKKSAREGRRKEGGRTGPEGQADRLKIRVDACAFGLVGGRAAGERPAAERSLAAARRRGRQRAGAGRRELALDVGAELRLLLADAEVALLVGNSRRAKELVPPWGGHRQGGNNHRPCSVVSCLGHEGVGRRKGSAGEGSGSRPVEGGETGREGRRRGGGAGLANWSVTMKNWTLSLDWATLRAS